MRSLNALQRLGTERLIRLRQVAACKSLGLQLVWLGQVGG